MLRLFLLLVIGFLLVGCENNIENQRVLSKEDKFYDFLKEELIVRDVLLVEENMLSIECYNPKSDNMFKALDVGLHFCIDSLNLLKLGYQEDEIQQFVARPHDRLFLWKKKIGAAVVSYQHLREKYVKDKERIQPVALLYPVVKEMYIKDLVNWSKPYFAKNNDKALLMEEYSTSPHERWEILRSYIFEDNTWSLVDTIQKIHGEKYYKLTF